MSNSLKSRHIMMMAAGTGGHVFPALAVAKALQARGHQVSWLATSIGMENDLLKQHHDIQVHQIAIQGIRGNGLLRKLKAPFAILSATLAARQLMKQQNIDAVAGFGGYVSGPGGLAARSSGIPILIHEQNAIAGMTNSVLARIANTVCQAFPNTFQAQEKVITTGNPVRQEICQIAPPEQRYAQREQQGSPLKIFIVGGSLGAKVLNERVPAALAALQMPLQIYHQCGKNQQQATEHIYQNLTKVDGFDVKVSPFIQDMAQAYSDADLVICRAGALTVTEIATAGVAAVFVPLPTAVDDHQTANARYLADVGAAKVCPQSTMTSESLAGLLRPLMRREVLFDMAKLAQQQAQIQATEQVADLIEKLFEK
ncbi:undecaprenyldiphospho-muramoylpentapeptide beta-N-acetylglucosaminyltransferase [Acinetobacter sp. c3-l95]|uniref:undecaprenyldiphospho-muramoylpentapeptide beta-N-acetylglucosaminyltransferase n=1 Tax=Acinetobacter sp. c3-l95 TaxID=3342804 RepID=UPI0035B73AC2